MSKTHAWMSALVVAGVVAPLQAATLTSTGNWNVGSNWDINAVPSAESITIASGRTVTLDSAVPSITQVTMGTSAGTGAWIINAGADITTTSTSAGRALTIGSSRTSNVTQTGGSVNATSGGMFLAYSGTGFVGTTTWDISGGSLALGSDPDDMALTNIGVVIGRQGSAEMNLSGSAVVTATGGIYLAQLGVSTATLNTALTIADNASFTSDRGLEAGLHNTNITINNITVSGGSITTGTAANSGSWRLSSGDGATTTFTQSAGIVNIGTNDVGDLVDDSLYLGYGLGTANYNFSGGTLNVDNYLDVGRTGIGNFTLSGSAVANVAHFRTGSQGSAAGISNINGGTINAEASLQVGVTALATGTVTQTAGNVTVGADGVLISGLETAGTATYNISGGSLTSSGALALGLGVSGTLNITDNAAQLAFGGYRFGANANLSAVSGTTIAITSNTGSSTVDGNILAMIDAGASSSALAGLANVTLVFNGGQVADLADLGGVEVAGQDLGAVFAGLVDNFALAGLQIGDVSQTGAVRLVDLADNADGVEALYVQNLIVSANSVVDLNGLNLYYVNATIDASATFINGTPTQIIPEPASLGLATIGGLLLAWRRRSR